MNDPASASPSRDSRESTAKTDGSRAARRRRTSAARRALCLLAALVCIAINALALLRGFGRNEQDDRTLLYATSALRPGNLEALVKLRSALPAIVSNCPGELCRIRTATRIASLPNYLALSGTIRLARLATNRMKAPFCERVSLAYYAGILLLHGSVHVVAILLFLTHRSPGRTFSVLALLMLLAAALDVRFLHIPSLVDVLAPLLPAAAPHYGTAAYAPRGALAVLFLLQLAAYASGRHGVWVALTLLAPFLHAAQATVFAAVFALALLLQIVLRPAERRKTVKLLLFLLAVYGAVLIIAWRLALGDSATETLAPLTRLPRSVAPVDLLWLACAGGLVLLVRRRGGAFRSAPALLLLASYLVVLALLRISVAYLRESEMGMAGEVYVRFVGGSSFVLGMLPWFAAALLARWLVTAVRPGVRPRLVTVVACLVLVASSTALLVERRSVERAWRASRRNLIVARTDLCQVTRCSELGCQFDGFLAMRPRREPVFHLQLFDLLNRWEHYRDVMRRSVPPPAARQAS